GSGPHHPHQRRAAPVQFSAVAGGLQRTRVRSHPLARLRSRRARAGHRRVSPPRAPLRGSRRQDGIVRLVGADQPAGAPDFRTTGRGDLGLRVASAAVLAPLAIAAAWLGGPAFLILCALAAIRIWWAWVDLSADGARLPMIAGIVALAAAAFALAIGALATALLCLVSGAVVAAACARAQRVIAGAGGLYAGVMLLAPVLLRADPHYGFLALAFLFAVVWTTDIAAYFVGRAVGGPKLARQLSPKKTWSGALGGAVWAVMASAIVAMLAGLPRLVVVALVGLVLSVASQGGDLFESALKRRYGAKDAGRLIPGHGGLMDRLDGFIAAALVAALLGLARSGVDAPARGLLVWEGQACTSPWPRPAPETLPPRRGCPLLGPPPP